MPHEAFYGGPSGTRFNTATAGSYLATLATRTLANGQHFSQNPTRTPTGRDYTIFPADPFGAAPHYYLTINWRNLTQALQGFVTKYTQAGFQNHPQPTNANHLFVIDICDPTGGNKVALRRFFRDHAQEIFNNLQRIEVNAGTQHQHGFDLYCSEGGNEDAGLPWTFIKVYTYPVGDDLTAYIDEMVEKSVWLTNFMQQHW
jgi:hypothetical protein